MFMHASNCRCLLFASVGFLLTVSLWCRPGNAEEEFYAVFGFEHSFSSVDYEKSASLNSPISLMTTSDNERGSVNALKAALGYRLPLSERVYLAGEIEGALYLNEDVRGFLKGTGEGDTDVWPGPWTLERCRAIGLNARLGYVPGSLDFMGSERSFYLFAGTRWVDAKIDAGHLNRRLGVTGSIRADRTLKPWLIGVGTGFGNAGHRFDLRLSYMDYDTDMGIGSGSMGDPILRYAFEIREWNVSLSYVISFGD